MPIRPDILSHNFADSRLPIMEQFNAKAGTMPSPYLTGWPAKAKKTASGKLISSKQSTEAAKD
jgi:hypothetical protein